LYLYNENALLVQRCKDYELEIYEYTQNHVVNVLDFNINDLLDIKETKEKRNKKCTSQNPNVVTPKIEELPAEKTIESFDSMPNEYDDMLI
jgi:hypothetical protein